MGKERFIILFLYREAHGFVREGGRRKKGEMGMKTEACGGVRCDCV